MAPGDVLLTDSNSADAEGDTAVENQSSSASRGALLFRASEGRCDGEGLESNREEKREKLFIDGDRHVFGYFEDVLRGRLTFTEVRVLSGLGPMSYKGAEPSWNRGSGGQG